MPLRYEKMIEIDSIEKPNVIIQKADDFIIIFRTIERRFLLRYQKEEEMIFNIKRRGI